MNRVEAINMIIEGLTFLRDDEAPVKESADSPATATANKSSIGKKAPVTKTAPAKKDAPAADESNGQTYTMDELSGMKYNEFKKLAASLGVDCKGSRNEIMQRVIATGVVTDASDEKAPAKESAPAGKKAPVKGAVSGKGKIGGAKKAPEKDEFDEKAESIAAETPFKEIVAALKDVGVTVTKMNYKTKLAEALREGLLDLADDDGGEDEESAEITSESYFPDYDLSEVNDPSKMSEVRLTACVQKQADILAAYESGELSEDDIIDYLQNNATQVELDLLGEDYTEEDLIALYFEVVKHFIDEDGEEHEPGDAYMIGEDAFCCGQPLKYDKKTKKFLCESCGSDYEAE